MRIWIDTDIGSDVDDAVALAYALRHPDLDVVGVSTVFGEVDLRTRIAEALLVAADAANVPVHTGVGVPLTPRRKGVMFGHEGRGIVDGAAPRRRITSEDGVEQRIDALATALVAAEPDVVLAIGPLTNVAALLDRDVDLPPLTVMGGRFTETVYEGMAHEIGEWNWFCDPDAARRVLDPGRPHRVLPRVVPADVTFRTRLAPGDVERLEAGDALCRSVAGQCRQWLDLQRDEFGRAEPRVALHDPLTVAVLVEPALCPFETTSVTVDDRGWTAAAPGPPNVDVATDVDPEATRDYIMATLTPTL